MLREIEPRDNPPRGLTRRDFLIKSATTLMGLAVAGCVRFLPESTFTETAKQKELLAASMEFWLGSSTVADVGYYLYRESLTNPQDLYDLQDIKEYTSNSGDYYNYLSLYEKSGHATLTHGHYRQKIPHFIGMMKTEEIKFPPDNSVINIFAGGNEMTDEDNLQDTLGNMENLIKTIRVKHPTIRINLINLFEIQVFKPNSQEEDREKKERIERWRRDYNKGLEDIASKNSQVSSIGVEGVVENNGQFDPTLLRDGRHLTEKSLKRFINKVRGVPPPIEISQYYFRPSDLTLAAQNHTGASLNPRG